MIIVNINERARARSVRLPDRARHTPLCVRCVCVSCVPLCAHLCIQITEFVHILYMRVFVDRDMLLDDHAVKIRVCSKS